MGVMVPAGKRLPGPFFGLLHSQCARTPSGSPVLASKMLSGWVPILVTRLDAPDILYRNKGDGTFEDVSTAVVFVEARIDGFPVHTSNGLNL